MASLILVGIIAVFVFLFNSLIMKRNVVDNALAAVDARRKLLCDAHLELLSELRKRGFTEEALNVSEAMLVFRRGASIAERAALDEAMAAVQQKFTKRVKTLDGFKNMPEIQALMPEIIKRERELRQSKEHYNEVTHIFNASIHSRIGSAFARFMHLSGREFFPQADGMSTGE